MKNKFNIFDLIILFTIFFSFTGFLIAKANKNPLNNIIHGKENVAIEISLPDVNSGSLKNKENFFKAGDLASITIRNHPYTKLKIIKSEFKPKVLILPNLSGSYMIHIDPTRENIKDYIITLADTALVTDDGYVLGGNKIKIGNQIDIEGFNYRLTGKVINIYPLGN